MPIQSEEIRASFRAHAVALTAVAVIFMAVTVIGLTSDHAHFILFPAAVAAVAGIAIASVWTLDCRLRHASARETAAGETIRSLRQRLDQAAAVERELREELRTTKRAWDDSRDQAATAQAALERAADEAESRLAALERLTDPGLNPVSGEGTISELLENLRGTVDADGVALVRVRSFGTHVVATVGLRPEKTEGPVIDAARFRGGRVTLIHNDHARIAQASALRWPESVTSLMTVPVICNGDVWATIEVANSRPKRASDWDVALVRVVADRLSAVGMQPALRLARSS